MIKPHSSGRGSKIYKFLRSSDFLNTALFGVITAALSYTVFRVKYLAGKTFIGVVGFFLCAAVCTAVSAAVIKLFGGKESFAQRIRNNKLSFLAAAITAVIMLFAFAVYQVVPFGDYTVLRMDLYHQYGPMFAELYDRVVAGDSLLYSFKSGAGNSFLGNFYNYLSSPIALIIFWFKRKYLVDSIAYMILIKCALSAGTFNFYLKKHHGKADASSVAFSLLYAFSAYFIAYYWNLMWLDAVVLIPLVLFGIEQIIKQRKMRYYVIALVLTMLTNYYMSFMVCIFSVIYFLVFYFSNYSVTDLYVPKSKDLPIFSRIYQSKFLNTGIRFVIGSIFAGLISAFALIPVYCALKSSSATGSQFPDEFELYFNIFDFIANHLASVDPTIRSSGEGVQPNVYCGILTIMLVPLYTLSKHISAREKISHITLLAVFLISFNTNIANFIWHGLHFPNDLPYRFSFIYSFILLSMAYKVFTNREQFSKKLIIGTGIGVFAVILLVQKLGTNYTDDLTIYVSIAFTALYTLLLLAFASKKIAKSLVGIVMICATVTEVLIADVPRLNFAVTRTSYISSYDQYKQVLNAVKEMDDSVYRVEISNVDNLLRMSPCWYDYNGINCFSSMEYEDMSNLQFKLGMVGNKINSFTYFTQTPVYNAMFGLKYIITNDSQIPLNDSIYTKVLSDVGKLSTYRNDYSLPLAFAVKSTTANYWETTLSNPFEVQNDFIKEATGIDEDVFKPIEVDLGVCNNCYITGFNYQDQNNFTVADENNYANFVTSFDTEKTANVYIYYASTTLSSLDITSDTYSISQTVETEPYILDLGVLQKGENVSIVANIDDESSEGWFRTNTYYLDEDVFKKAYAILNDDGAMSINNFTDTEISGDITLQSGEMVYTSIPYDEGWTAYIDGNETQTVKIANSLLGVTAGSGEHELTLKFTPKGLKTGIIISAAAVFTAGVYEGIKWLIIRKIQNIVQSI